jgi:hypothetical protein
MLEAMCLMSVPSRGRGRLPHPARLTAGGRRRPASTRAGGPAFADWRRLYSDVTARTAR